MECVNDLGATRPGRGAENQDGFASYPGLGLHVVVDGFTTARIVPVVLDAIATAIDAAIRAGRGEDGALTRAVRSADQAVKRDQVRGRALAGAGAELAALWLRDGLARLAWTGNCQIYRLRDDAIELISDPRWVERFAGIGAPELQLEVFERVVPAAAGDVFLLATDGFLPLGAGDDRTVLAARAGDGGGAGEPPDVEAIAARVSVRFPDGALWAPADVGT